MRNFSLYNIFDIIFRVVIIYILSFVWIRYFIKNLALSLVLASIFTLVCEIIIQFVKKKLQQKNKISKDEQKEIENMTNSFVYSTETQNINFFYNLAKTKHNAVKKSKYIEIIHPNTKIILFPFFLLRELNAQDIIYVYNKTKNANPKRIVICTNNFDNTAQTLANKLPTQTVLLDSKQTYFNLIKKYGVYPPKVELKIPQRQTFNDLLSYALNKKRTKGYLFSSILILFCSFFVPYNLYYIIMSSVLLILAFASFSNIKFNKRTPVKLLDI